MNVWLLMIAIGAITFSVRASLILTAGRYRIPETLERALRYVPPAVLTALILPQFVVLDGRLAIEPQNVRLLAGTIAAIVAGTTRNMLATIAAGMAALWILRYLFY